MLKDAKNQKEAEFHQYMTRHIDSCKFTQKEIADRLGYSNANVITMFKKGTTRFPVHIIPELSKIIGLDPAHTLRMALEAYNDPMLSVIEEYCGSVISKNELALLDVYRKHTGNSDPNTTSSSAKELIRVLAEELVS